MPGVGFLEILADYVFHLLERVLLGAGDIACSPQGQDNFLFDNERCT